MEETGVPGGNHRPTASNWWNFSHIRPLPSPGIELGPQRCEAKWATARWERRLSSPSYRGPQDIWLPTAYLCSGCLTFACDEASWIITKKKKQYIRRPMSPDSKHYLAMEVPLLPYSLSLTRILWCVVWRHMLTRQMLTRQMLTRQMLTSQMLTTLMEKETFAHNFFYNLYLW